MKRFTLGFSVGLLLLSERVAAYPTSAVFTPTAESRQLGEIGVLGYTGVALAPRLALTPSWLGTEVGLLPKYRYGNSGVSFGGLEVGGDLIAPYDRGVKPVMNAKLSVLTEGTYSPAIAVGLMESTVGRPAMNLAYATQSKTFHWGSITLGFGAVLGNRSQYEATTPLPFRSRSLLMGAYQSPLAWNRVGFIVDYIGGVSEISSTYVGLAGQVLPDLQVQIGGFLSNKRSEPYDGGYGMLVWVLDSKSD